MFKQNDQNKMNTESDQLLENTALAFAARYTHNRNTGGTFAIVRCLIANWDRITPSTQKMILREAYNEAQYNRDDWQKLFDHANYKPTEQ
jgi:hypothetical protein